MGINNEGIVNRRQLLVRAGSFMKMSWRKSREELIDNKDNEGGDNGCLRKSKKSMKRNLSVRFSDDSSSVSSNDELSDEEIENRWYQVCFFLSYIGSACIKTHPIFRLISSCVSIFCLLLTFLFTLFNFASNRAPTTVDLKKTPFWHQWTTSMQKELQSSSTKRRTAFGASKRCVTWIPWFQGEI